MLGAAAVSAVTVFGIILHYKIYHFIIAIKVGLNSILYKHWI